jgi:cytoskeletal protein RodZ
MRRLGESAQHWAKQMMQKMFCCVLIASMLFNKPSKKTQKKAEENTAPESAMAAEASKPRASRSSKSKSSEASETGSVKHRKSASKAAAVPQEAPVPEVSTMAATPQAAPVQEVKTVASAQEPAPVSRVKTMAAAAGAEQSVAAVSAEPVAATPKIEPAPAQRAVSQQEIAHLAYSYWVERGYAPGSAEADWLRAEQELTARL